MAPRVDLQPMRRRYHVRPLARDRIDATFPIVQAARPGLTLEEWRRFAAGAATADHSAAPGIMVVENQRGYIQGFCTYGLQSDIRHGTILAVNDLVALSLVDTGAVAAALVDALEALARRTGCSVVRLQVAEEGQERSGSPMLSEFLRRSSHASRTVRLARPVDLMLD